MPQVVDDGTNGYLHDVTGNSVAIGDTTDDATYPLADALGSTRLTLDDTGTPLGTTDWDAWGNERTSTGAGFEFGYTGQQYDGSSDLYFNRARYYSPGTAQFLSRDTIQPSSGGATGYNPYQYANSNPTTFTDPSGHLASIGDFGGGIAGAFLYLAYIFECFLDGNCRYQMANAIADAARDTANEMVRGLKSAWEWTKDIVQRGWQWVSTQWPDMPNPGKVWDKATEYAGDAWEKAKSLVPHTWGSCVGSLSLTLLYVFSFEFYMCALWDDKGNTGFSVTAGHAETVNPRQIASQLSKGSNLIGYNAVVTGIVSTASTLFDLSGWSVYTNGQLPWGGFVVAGGFSVGTANDGATTYTWQLGGGQGMGLGRTTGVSRTWVYRWSQIPSLLRDIFP